MLKVDNISSPCVKNCCLNEQDICLGCYRTLDEILSWYKAKPDEKIQILKNCEQRKIKP